jgi:hypothetical protein
MRRVESPLILQTARNSSEFNFKAQLGCTDYGSIQNSQSTSNLSSSTNLTASTASNKDVSFSPAQSCSDLPIIPSSQ